MSNPLPIMTPEETQQHRAKGAASRRTGKDPFTGFVETYGVKPDDSNRVTWLAFHDGCTEVDAEVKAAKRVTYRVDEFLERLTALCAEYDAEISSGCGCCGAGLYVKDYETELNVPASQG